MSDALDRAAEEVAVIEALAPYAVDLSGEYEEWKVPEQGPIKKPQTLADIGIVNRSSARRAGLRSPKRNVRVRANRGRRR